ncbi:hypothetical protein [Streptomyces sp. PA5.6]|uniref:hypothetical protein n=1 Tax=Streptomyces sp. PA5.6 TaxID=3035651 RepID=UPI003904C78C
MTTRFRLNSNGTRLHHLMVEATTTPKNQSLANMDSSFALSLVLDEADLTNLRAAVQATEVTVLKTRLADMTKSYEQAKKARETDKTRIANLGADHARTISQLRQAQRAHDDTQRRDGETISRLTAQVATLRKAVEEAEQNQRNAEIERQDYKTALSERDIQYNKLRKEHRTLADGYQRIVGQNAKFLAAAPRPTFFFDAATAAELEHLRAELESAHHERDAARADARATKRAYDDLLTQWEGQ